MQLIKSHELQDILVDILQAAGTPPDIAEYVSSSLVDSNLKGVDSHGAIRISMYVDQIEEGYLKPASRPEVVKQTPTTAIVRGHLGFGMHALGYALDVAIRKAKEMHISAVGLYENTHTGRIGRYSAIGAEQDLFVMVSGGGANKNPDRHAHVAPYGGAKRVLGTNPITFGLPGGRFGPVVVDTSTSMTAEGKLRFYQTTKTPLPQGWILDNKGRPSTNAEDFFAGGVILPAAGHKGYGFGLVAELLGDALIGEPYELNWFILALDIAAFRPPEEFIQASERLLQKLKDTPAAEGFEEVMIPGEPESRMEKNRSVEGIPIPDEIWEAIQATARQVGVEIR